MDIGILFLSRLNSKIKACAASYKCCFIGGLFLVFMYLSPYIILGPNCLFNIGDNLDSNVVYYKTLSESKHYWCITSDCVLDEYMAGGVPRAALPSPLNITSLLFLLFSPLSAYLVNIFLARIIGFIGMYLLLGRYILQKNLLAAMSVAVIFAALDSRAHFSVATFTIAPLVAYAFLNILIKKEYKFYNFLILTVASFFSSFVMVNAFLMATMAGWLFVYAVIKRQIPLAAILAFLLYAAFTIIAEINLFLLVLNSGFVSQRIERSLQSVGFVTVLEQFADYMTCEKFNHQVSLHFIPMVIFLPVFLFAIVKKSYQTIIIPAIALLANTVLSVILNWNVFNPLKLNFTLIRSFDFSRFTSLNAFYWWVLFGSMLSQFTGQLRVRKFKISVNIIVIALCLLSLLYVFWNSWGFRRNLSLLIVEHNSSENWENNMQTFNDFYAPELFNKIRSSIDTNELGYTVSLGLHPGVLRYNGFKTIDGYTAMYSRSHHDKFSRLIEGEFPFIGKQAKKFKKWGNRCYVFNPEVMEIWKYKDYILTKTSSNKYKINNLRINPAVLGEFGCTHLFSTLEIGNSDSLSLELQGVFELGSLPYKIFLYKYIG